jgi:hypothetical protein
VYVSDWKESHLDGAVLVMDERTGLVSEIPVKMKTPTGLFYVEHRKRNMAPEGKCI